MKKLIEFQNIVKKFDDTVVLKGIDLDIYENEFVTLLGPSGCGKTTLLRMLGGFLRPDEGQIIFDGEPIDDVPAYKRPINTIFQKYALFPHLNVYDNIAFGLKLKKMPKDIIEAKVSRMIQLVDLQGREKDDISVLSGGQQQRVAIARALINEPDVLLLDEPLAALDLKLRKEMQHELKRIQQEVGITFIFVTHDQEEALTMSDKIVVIKDGKIQQIGTPEEIYNEPVNQYVANFIGESNIIDGIMKRDGLVNFDDKDYPCVDRDFKTDEPVDVVIRPEDIDIVDFGKGKLNGEIKSVHFKGVHYEVMVETRRGTSKTVTMHVMSERDIVNQEAGELMHASDFSMDIEDVTTMTDQEIIARANAQAWKADSEEDISISEVVTDLMPTPGRYQVTFKTHAGTSITVNINVVEPKYVEDDKDNMGITAFDFYKTVDEIKESMAISVDLKTWADAYAWYIDNDEEAPITEVRFSFDPNQITEGDYKITFSTEGREYKVHTTKCFEEGARVAIDFGPEDIHVMSKMGGQG